jgi:predicted tellurium resistance membrane protein TerC
VLGWDNIFIVTLLAGGVDPAARRRGTAAGLALGLALRIGALVGVLRLVRVARPFWGEYAPGDVVLVAGGAFLVYKAVAELRHAVKALRTPGAEPAPKVKAPVSGASATIAQIALFDLVFSIDSVMAAIGLTRHLGLMVGAVTLSFVLALLATEALGAFIRRNPAVRALCLVFLFGIGLSLALEGLHFTKP